MSGFTGDSWTITAVSAFSLFQFVVLAEVYEESLRSCRHKVGKDFSSSSLIVEIFDITAKLQEG